MEVNTASLKGRALDWAVGMSQGMRVGDKDIHLAFTHGLYNPSSSWGLAGPIIEREEMVVAPYGIQGWVANDDMVGATPLEAAMRMYVASKLGDKVEIPEELICV